MLLICRSNPRKIHDSHMLGRKTRVRVRNVLVDPIKEIIEDLK